MHVSDAYHTELRIMSVVMLAVMLRSGFWCKKNPGPCLLLWLTLANQTLRARTARTAQKLSFIVHQIQRSTLV